VSECRGIYAALPRRSRADAIEAVSPAVARISPAKRHGECGEDLLVPQVHLGERPLGRVYRLAAALFALVGSP